MSVFLKNAVSAFYMACALCACALDPPKGPLPRVPLADSKPFPDIPHDFQASGYALKCAHGYYTDKHIDKSELKRAHGNEARPDPQGKGKIYTRYAMWWNGLTIASEYWGYTFTIHTTDEGVITECAATQQLLEKK